MYENLRRAVCEANKSLHEKGLAPFAWGNVSQVDRINGVFAVRPAGIGYNDLTVENMVVISLKTGEVVDGSYTPTTDADTYFVLYNEFPELNAVAHVHTPNATAFSQVGRDIIPYGITHIAFSKTEIPCVRALTAAEVNDNYELNTGKVIVEHFKSHHFSPETTTAVLTKYHAPYVFGSDANTAVKNAAILEMVAETALKTDMLAYGKAERMDSYLAEHYGNSK